MFKYPYFIWGLLFLLLYDSEYDFHHESCIFI